MLCLNLKFQVATQKSLFELESPNLEVQYQNWSFTHKISSLNSKFRGKTLNFDLKLKNFEFKHRNPIRNFCFKIEFLVYIQNAKLHFQFRISSSNTEFWVFSALIPKFSFWTQNSELKVLNCKFELDFFVFTLEILSGKAKFRVSQNFEFKIKISRSSTEFRIITRNSEFKF